MAAPPKAPVPGPRTQIPTPEQPQNPPAAKLKFDYDRHATRRMEIYDNTKLKLHLQDWEEEKKQVWLRVEAYRGRCNAVKTELYQLMGFYTVFQGVVFSAVATSMKLSCRTSFNPALLSLLASIATAFSVHFKLTYYEIQNLKLIRAQDLASNIHDKISRLKGDGENFDFATINDSIDSSNKKLEMEAKAHRWFYLAVMLFLSVFSVMILVSCVTLLCWDADKKKVMPCAWKLCW